MIRLNMKVFCLSLPHKNHIKTLKVTLARNKENRTRRPKLPSSHSYKVIQSCITENFPMSFRLLKYISKITKGKGILRTTRGRR